VIIIFLERVQELVSKAKISKRKFLKELGLNHNAYNDWKKKQFIPSGEAVAKIANYFNVSADYLLGITDNPNRIDAKPEQLSNSEAAEVLRLALKDSELVGDDGELSKEGAEIISTFILANKGTLKKLIKKD